MQPAFFILLISFFFLTACNNPVSKTSELTQTIDTIGQQINYQTTYKSVSDSSKWKVDSVYDQTVQGLVTYHYQSNQSTAAALTNHAYKRTWKTEKSAFPNYPYQYTSTWQVDSAVTYRDGQTPLRSFSTIQATILSPQTLSYATLAPAFELIYQQLRLQVAFYTPRLPAYRPTESAAAPLVRFSLRPTSTDGKTMNYGNPNFLEQDAVWLPEQQLLLPLDITVSIPKQANTMKTIVTTANFPAATEVDEAQ